MAAAIFNLAINYDTSEQARIVAALINRYTTTVPPFVPTQAQAIEAFRQSTMKALQDIIRKYESDQAHAQAEAGITNVGTLS